MVWVIAGVVVVLILVFLATRQSKGEPSGRSREPASMPPPSKRGSARLTAAEVLARVRALESQQGQWPEIWSQLNPGNDPALQQLLLELRNDGLQFAPTDGLRRIEQAAQEFAQDSKVDAIAVLKKVLGRGDWIDTYK